MNLREIAKQLGNNLPLMEGREKAELEVIVGKNVTIRDYGFMKDEHNKEYVAFIVDEDESNFFFGGQVLTEGMIEIESQGCRSEVQKDGLPILLGKKMGKNKREYTTVKYYPN